MNNKQKFRQIVGPTVKKINDKQLYKASGSFRPLAELLVEWYEKKLAQKLLAPDDSLADSNTEEK